MAISRIMALALALVGWTIVAAPAHACDSNYPWLCPPVPSIDPPADATAEPAKGAKPAKPAPTANRHAAKAANTKANAKATARKIAARKAAMHRFAARAHMKTVMANKQAEAAAARADIAEVRTRPVPVPNPRQVVASPRTADGYGGASNGFASMWAERSVAAMDAPPPEAPADTSARTDGPPVAAVAPAAAAVAAAPAAVAPHSEANEMDLAADVPPPAPTDQSWVRSLFLAFGGLLAAGTALRFFI